MLNQSSLVPKYGTSRTPKRLGRGNGSWKWTFSGKGCKGQNSRTGRKFNASFEGGQTPLFRRLPKKRGFTALNQVKFSVVNLDQLQKLSLSGVNEISPIELFNNGLIRKGTPVKILWSGSISAKLTVSANAFSLTAKTAIEKSGGSVIVLS